MFLQEEEARIDNGAQGHQNFGCWFANEMQQKREARALACYLTNGTDASIKEVYNYLNMLLAKRPKRRNDVRPMTAEKLLEDADDYAVFLSEYAEYLDHRGELGRIRMHQAI